MEKIIKIILAIVTVGMPFESVSAKGITRSIDISEVDLLVEKEDVDDSRLV